MSKYGASKIAWFPEKLESLRTGYVTAPVCVRIKPTNRCCHNCSWCVYRHSFSGMHETCNRTDEIPYEKLSGIITDLVRLGTKTVIFSGGGEPLVYTKILGAMLQCQSGGLGYAMITNGQLLCGHVADVLADADWIRISMDYWDGDSFMASRGTLGFDTLCSNVADFAARDMRSQLGANFVVTKDNYEHLYEATKLMIDIGIGSVRFSPLWVPGFVEYHSPFLQSVAEHIVDIRARFVKEIVVLDSYEMVSESLSRDRHKCWYNQITPVVAADQNVYTCHNMAYDPRGKIGSIANQTFRDLWFSKETTMFFKSFDPAERCVGQCSSDNRNRFIDDLMRSYGDNYP